MTERRLSPKVQTWLDLMPVEAPDRLFNAVMAGAAGAPQVQPRLASLRRALVRPRTVAALIAIALLLAALVVPLLIGTPPRLPGPRVYLNQVVPGEPLAAARAHPVLVTLDDGRVLAVGGEASGPVGEIVDPATAARVPLDAPAAGDALRQAYAAGLLQDGRVFVLAPGEAWVFDPVAAAFARLPGMTAARAEAGMAVLSDGRVAIVGGYDIADPGNSLASAEVFDPSTGRFAAAPGRMLWGRQGMSIVPLPNGDAAVFSGDTRIDGGRLGNSQAELFDAASGTFRSLSSLVDTRTQAVLLPDNRVALFDVPEPYQRTGAMTFFDLATKTPTPVKPLPYVVNAALLLEDGRVLLVGAEASGNRAGIFDPATAELEDAPALRSWSPSAALLQDGRVLLAGGFEAAEPANGNDPLPPAVQAVEIFQ